jgi:hypothetical protein
MPNLRKVTLRNKEVLEVWLPDLTGRCGYERKGRTVLLWLPTEDHWLRVWYEQLGPTICGELLGRSKPSVWRRAVEDLGLRYGPDDWKGPRLQSLLAMFRQHGAKMTAKHFGISRAAASSLAQRQGVRYQGYHPWTGAEERQVHKVVERLAEILGRPPSAVAAKAQALFYASGTRAG